MRKKCDHEKCTRFAAINNTQYHPNKWLCTYHSNRVVREGRRQRKYGNRIMEKNKTAVDWLVSQLNKNGFAKVVTDEEVAKAKKVEKEQLEDAWKDGSYNGSVNGFNQYYNETYGNDKNKCVHCGSGNVIMFTADDNICQDCNKIQ